MDSFYNCVDLKCPFCLSPIPDSNPGETICPNCQAEFEVDEGGESVFANQGNLKLPVKETVCKMCGLVQGEGRDKCGYCGSALLTNYH